MINTTTPEPLISLTYACQDMLFWHDEFQSELEWTALNKENTFLEHIRELLPLCMERLSHDPDLIDCK